MKLQCITCLIFLFGWSALSAQLPDVPPSPNASAMIKFANIQVSHYTGVPNISVPLGTLPGKDISIPVSLDYHASGIKVQDVASSAGLGWNLNAGGAITRVIRGLPDGIKSYCSAGPANYWSNYTEQCDGERDIFYFSFLGRSGKMFIDNNSTAQTMPYQDIEIVTGLSGTTAWVITDEFGYKYYFGENPAEREQITYYTGNSSSGYTEKYTFNSTWYLNKIISPSGLQIATFTYYAGSDFEYEMYAQQYVDPPGVGSTYLNDTNTKIKIKQAKYINTITTAVASVQFGYVNTRQDLPNCWQLNAVNFKDQNGFIKGKAHLVLDYFSCIDTHPSSGIIASCRLRLSAVKVGVNTLNESYSFLYNEGSENPSRQNFFIDHYGYYNKWGFPYNNPYYRVDYFCNSNGVYKSSNSSKISIFSLIEIRTNSGDRTVFEYDQIVKRSLRIKSISKSDGLSLVAKSIFTYGADQGVITPVYSYTAHDGTIICTSSSFKDLYDLNGTTVGYSTVTETFLDGSKIVRNFTNFSDSGCNDAPPVVTKYKVTPPLNGTITNLGTQDVNGPPFASSTTKFWMRGLPKSVNIYDSQNNLLKKDEMTYQEENIISTVQNTALHNYKQTYGSNQAITYMSGIYNLESRPVNLVETKSYTYDQNGYSNFILDKSTYSYHSLHKTFPASITRQVGAGPHEKVTFRYPIDVAGIGATPPTLAQSLADGIWHMSQRNIIKPIERVSWFKDIGSSTFKIVGAELMTYRRNFSLQGCVLNSSYRLVISDPITALTPEATLINSGTVFSYDQSRYRLIETYTYDDNNATLTYAQSANGITTGYEWSNNTLPTATIVIPGANQFKKSYVLNSLLGLTQTTDENGQNSYAEYDSNFGRTRLTRDQDNNILTRYRYHYKDQSESLSNTVISVGAGCANQPISFSSPENVAYGETTYYWDFGDGSSATSTGPTTHSYSSYGTYEVKLRKENPEYFSLQTKTQATVLKPITNFFVSVIGPSIIDLCNPASTQTILDTNVTGDAASYYWEYSFNNGPWTFLTQDSVTDPPPGFSQFGTVGCYDVRCSVTDFCGNSFIDYYTLSVYESNPGNCQY